MDEQERNEYDVQCSRIESAANSLVPDCRVIFNHNERPKRIWFLIKSKSGAILVPRSWHRQVRELAQKTDEELKWLLQTLAHGKMQAAR